MTAERERAAARLAVMDDTARTAAMARWQPVFDALLAAGMERSA